MEIKGYLVYSTTRSGWNYKVNLSSSICYTDKRKAELYLAEMTEKYKTDSHTFWFLHEITIQSEEVILNEQI